MMSRLRYKIIMLLIAILLVVAFILIPPSQEVLDQEMIDYVTSGDIRGVEELITLGANVNAKYRTLGLTALMIAAGNSDYQMVKYLIDKGSAINTKNDNGWTALMRAARRGNVELVKYLIDNGADVYAKDNFGRTVFMWAARSNNVEMVKYFVDNGADIYAKDSFTGRSVLMWAAKDGTAETVEYLINKGADVNAKDSEGKTALDYAKEREELTRGKYLGHENFVKIINILKAAGAKE